MKKLEWNDKQLEELLHQLPKVIDHRHPHDIYQNISSKLNKRKKLNWIVPTIACSGALLLFFLLTPGFLNKTNFSSDQTAESTHEQHTYEVLEDNSVDHPISDKEDKQNSLQGNEEMKTEDQELPKATNKFTTEKLTAVYEQDLENYDQITYAIPDQIAQNIVPITVLIDKDETLSWFEQFKQAASLLTESAWSLADYYPLNADITYDKSTKRIHIDLPSDHMYGQGSAGYVMFTRALQETFAAQSGAVNMIVFTTDNEKGFEGHGENIEQLPVKQLTNRAHYLFYANKEEKPYIVPFTTVYENIEDALMNMEKPIAEYELSPAIPKHVSIERVKSEDGELRIYLSENTELKNDETALYFIEATLLTAKDFGFSSVKFENSPINQVGPFTFDQSIHVPIGMNKRVLNE